MAVDNNLQKSQKWASVLQSQIRMDSFIGMKIANTKFTIDQIVAMAVRKDNTASPTIVNGIWVGTQGQYDAIGTKNSNTLYFIV